MIFRTALLVSGVAMATHVAFAASTTPKPATAAGANSAAAAQPSAGCAGSQAIDACLVGNWEVTVDGAAEFARKRLHATNVQVTTQGRRMMTLKGEGTFFTGEMKTKATVDKDQMHGESAMVTQASGRWSAAGGKVNYCASAMKVEGTTTVTVGGRKITVPVKPQGPSVSTQSYTCAGDTLTQVTTVGKAGDITTVFKRVP